MTVDSIQYFSIILNSNARTDLTGVDPSLQVPSTQHPGSDGVIIQLVTRVPVDDLN